MQCSNSISSWLVWVIIEFSACCYAQLAHKPFSTSKARKQVLRAYCQNLYTVLSRPDGMFDYVCNCNETSHFVKLKFGRSPFPFTEKMFVALANEVRFLDDFLFSPFTSNFELILNLFRASFETHFNSIFLFF